MLKNNVAKAKGRGGEGGGLGVVSDGWGGFPPRPPQKADTSKSQARLIPGLTRQREAVRRRVSLMAR